MQDTQTLMRRQVLFLSVILSVFAVVQHLGIPGIDHDELEGVRWGATKSWFHDSHPPFSGFVAYWWSVATGYSALAFKFLSKLNALLAFFVVYILTREFLKPHAALIAAAAYASTYAFITLASQMDANSINFVTWPFMVLALWRALNTGKLGWWLALGFVAGLAVLGKYHTLLLIGVAFLYILARRDYRPTLGKAGFWLALALFILMLVPHVRAYLSYEFSMVDFVVMRGQHSGEVFAGRLSVIPYVGNQVLINLFGLAILLWQCRGRLGGLAIFARRKSWDNCTAFLLAFGFLFPLTPVAVSLILGASVLGSWGLSAWFLTPGAILYACFPELRAGSDKVEGAMTDNLRLGPYQVFFPIFILLGSGLAIANNFVDIARPSPIPRTIAAADAFWNAHSNEPIALAVSPERAGQGMAFYSEDKPLVLHRADPEIYGWVLDEKYCSHGPVLVIVEDDSRGRRYLTEFIEKFGEPDFAGDVPVPSQRVRLTVSSSQDLKLAGYRDPVCFR